MKSSRYITLVSVNADHGRKKAGIFGNVKTTKDRHLTYIYEGVFRGYPLLNKGIVLDEAVLI